MSGAQSIHEEFRQFSNMKKDLKNKKLLYSNESSSSSSSQNGSPKCSQKINIKDQNFNNKISNTQIPQ